MQFLALATIAVTLCTASGKNILLTNDDGWAATNIRALHRDLTAAGHHVVTVAPTVQMSGNGARFGVPASTTLKTPALFNHPPAGSPSWGHEEDDYNIWYFDGTPAACVAAGLDYIIPNYFSNMTIDLVLAGPNEGNNQGERDFVISGTIGAINYGVQRGYSGIALSGANSNNSFFKDNLNDNPNDAPNIYSKKTVELVNQLFESQGENPRLLPLSSGLNVNFAVAGEDLDSDCIDLQFKQTRFTGPNAKVYKIGYNETSNMILGYLPGEYDPVKYCAAGDCSLPDEFSVVKTCAVAITAFTLDSDVDADTDAKIFSRLTKIVF
ncbi:hypothetical protein BVG19_g1209 [[Candida] boidinii]|nr:hypothetical protein BVG19_g1209 [[Candida] boidinii]OWB51160.1 hypothetical protein B5S27_g2719 [[Candida] boidinii]